jgi:hypothetical protein
VISGGFGEAVRVPRLWALRSDHSPKGAIVSRLMYQPAELPHSSFWFWQVRIR